MLSVRRAAFGAMLAAVCACPCIIAAASPAAEATPIPAATSSATASSLLRSSLQGSPPQVTLPAPSVTLADLRALASKIGTAGMAVIVVDGTSDLSLDGYSAPSVSQQWWQVIRQLGADALTVVVRRAEPTGTAGSLLYALATERVAAAGATVTRLPGELAQGQSPACDQGLCASLASAAIAVPAGSSPGSGNPVVVPSAAASGGVSTWLLIALLVVAALALWLAAGRRLLRRMNGHQLDGLALASVGSPAVAAASVPSAPPPRPAPAGKPALASRAVPARKAVRYGAGQAIVRTVMRPEGYVEIDGVLYRATWRGSRDAPLRGAVVAVRRDQYGDLVAVDSGPGRDRPG